MKKESTFMLVVGIVVGILVMLFISFQLQLSNVGQRTTALEEAVNQNSQTLESVVNFLNQGAQQQAPEGQNPAATPTE
ncbi:hypothetical protein K9M50_00980 [Patescibacteria group bacterium]|nr:hypothetical protein [Patescibacteria group bacterium]